MVHGNGDDQDLGNSSGIFADLPNRMKERLLWFLTSALWRPTFVASPVVFSSKEKVDVTTNVSCHHVPAHRGLCLFLVGSQTKSARTIDGAGIEVTFEVTVQGLAIEEATLLPSLATVINSFE